MRKTQRLLGCVVVAVLLAACTGTEDAIEVEDPRRGVVAAEWVEEFAVPAATEVPDTPPALGPSSTPQIIHTEPDAVFLVVWGNNCRPDLTVGGSGSPSEFFVVSAVAWDDAESCRGHINEWFARVETEEWVDTSVARVAHSSLDGYQSDR